MSSYDYDEPSFDAPKRFSLTPWDYASIAGLVVILCLAGYFLMVFVNPQSALNPLKPPTPIPPVYTPTYTATFLQLPPTWTSTPTIEPSPTRTLAPTWTPWETPTVAMLVKPTNTKKPTSTPKPIYAFAASLTPIASTIIHPESGCNWLGVGGSVLDKNNSPVNGIVVHIAGKLGSEAIDSLTVSGTAPQYGQGGFEFALGTTPVATKNTLWIQLLDQAGLPLSDRVTIVTYTACEKNLILIRFKKVK
jgi:hypothetical protein